jgi:hypothetical protein
MAVFLLGCGLPFSRLDAPTVVCPPKPGQLHAAALIGRDDDDDDMALAAEPRAHRIIGAEHIDFISYRYEWSLS